MTEEKIDLLQDALELLAVATFITPKLQAKRAEVINAGLQALEQPAQHLNDPCKCGKQTMAWCAANTCSKAEQPAQQQEPVAFSQFLSDVMTAAGLLSHGKQSKALSERLGKMVVHYRTRPQAREPLTDEQIDKLEWAPSYGNPLTLTEGLRLFAREVEAAHGIKGDA